MSLAIVKQDWGNGLGKSETGALVASTVCGSASFDTKEGDGLTANPWCIDQSLMDCTRYSSCSVVVEGG